MHTNLNIKNFAVTINCPNHGFLHPHAHDITADINRSSTSHSPAYITCPTYHFPGYPIKCLFENQNKLSYPLPYTSHAIALPKTGTASVVPLPGV